jgi:hypothetical protein
MCLVDPSRVAASRVSDARRFDAFPSRVSDDPASSASRFVAVRRASGQRASSDRVVDVAPLGPRDEIFSTF